uniref:Uncharacterized protein n=1 Tax=Panagrellus redivivus TaxID=6233 RepID=A0A7E4VG66_PANRE
MAPASTAPIKPLPVPTPNRAVDQSKPQAIRGPASLSRKLYTHCWPAATVAGRGSAKTLKVTYLAFVSVPCSEKAGFVHCFAAPSFQTSVAGRRK